MATYSFFHFAVVAIFSLSITNGQKPCCGPERWAGHLLQKIGAYNMNTTTASKADIDSYIYYDYTGKQMAVEMHIKNTTFKTDKSIRRIVDYNKGMEWRIEGENCTRHQVTEPMRSPCFLDGATFFGYHTMNILPVEVWFMDNGKGHTVRTTQSRDPCIFVTDAVRSLDPDFSYELSFGLYENVTVDFFDPDRFNVPSFCPRSGPVSISIYLSRVFGPTKAVVCLALAAAITNIT